MAKTQRQVSFTLNFAGFERVSREAAEIGLPLYEYARLRVLGVIGAPAPAMPQVAVTAEIKETTAGRQSIGTRLLAAMEQDGWQAIREGRGVIQYAAKLGVTRRQLLGALGSLVASRKMVRREGAYRLVEAPTAD